MSDLIRRQSAIAAIKTWGLLDGLSEGQAIEILADEEKVPSAQPDRELIEQLKWERDTAIQQLKDLGYGLGEKPKTGDTISRQAAIEVIDAVFPVDPMKSEYAQGIACGAALAKTYVEQLPSEQPEIIRCKDCKNQEKFFQKDGRRKDGGYYIYGCSLAEGYSHVCLDDDYCSRAERRTDE